MIPAVPAEAVEAAARVIVRTVVERSWESLLPSRQEWYKVQARLSLEAAAPDMFAPVVEVADRLEESTLSGDAYLSGRGSGFRMAGMQIKQALGMEPKVVGGDGE